MYYNKKDNRTLQHHQLKSELNASFPFDAERVGEDWYLVHTKEPLPTVFGKNVKFTDYYLENDVCYQRQEYEDIPLAQLKVRLNNNVKDWLNRQSSSYTYEYPEEEKATFPQQLLEARAYLKDNTTPTPFLEAIAVARNKTVDEIAQGVVENADKYAQEIGTLVGRCREFYRRIEAAQTLEELEQINTEL